MIEMIINTIGLIAIVVVFALLINWRHEFYMRYK